MQSDSQLLPVYQGSRLQYQLRQGTALRSLGTQRDENTQPFVGGNEQLAGRSDLLLFACSLTPNTPWISYKAQREAELDACLAQEFDACLSAGIAESSWGLLRQVVGCSRLPGSNQVSTFPLSRRHICFWSCKMSVLSLPCRSVIYLAIAPVAYGI